jgi:carboxyl-terminal processing protease
MRQPPGLPVAAPSLEGVSEMPRRNVTWLLGMLVFTLFCWTIAQGGLLPVAASHGPLQTVRGLGTDHQDYERLRLFLDVMQHIETAYVHELNPEERRKFIEAAIDGGMQSLDQHSNFLTEREFASFRKTSRGSFGGIGVNIIVPRDTKRLTIVTPIVGTPAYQAGVKPGDEIMKIEGQSTDGMSQDDAVDKITGQPGTPVKITIRHRGSSELIDLTLIRSQIEVESIMGDRRDSSQKWDYMYDKDARLGYVRLVNFGQKTEEELRKVLEQLEEQGANGLVLDLRGNPGGLLDSAVKISDLFLKPGEKIVSIAGRTRAEGFEAAAGKKHLESPFRKPIVVLVNNNSASASEIVAAALQDNNRAIVLGERSYGKGSVQNVIELESGKSAMKLTTAKYLRPSGKNIHRFTDSKETDDWGVRPDIEVKLTAREDIEYFLARRDRDTVRTKPTPGEQADHAAAACLPLATLDLIGQPGFPVAFAFQMKRATRILPQPPLPFQDRMLDEAIKHLRKQVAPQTSRNG